jgi:tetratricopeptide (TPR) repeat protein
VKARRSIGTQLAAALALAALVACSGPRRTPGDDAPTLAQLPPAAGKLEPDAGPVLAETQTIAAYRKFLAAAPGAPQRAEAMRRLGDLEMDNADRRAAQAPTAAAGAADVPDYTAAIAQYQAFLKAYPDDPRHDRALYQLARAQESSGQLEAALATLTQLVQRHPGTLHADESHFRRGEMLFALRQYGDAEAAYAQVLQAGRSSPFGERALYMQGWSLYKLGRIDDALVPFFGVLDVKLGRLSPLAREEADLADIRQLSRADRELVDDTFRIVSISLAGLQGAASVPRHIGSPVRQGYQFRVYQQLAELYIRQDRIKDAADTLAAFVRIEPLHVQAPLLQARVIDIYRKNGFDSLALQAKKDHVQRYGASSEFRRASASGWARAQPLVKAHLAELAQHYHALAQKSHLRADVQEAAHWYRELLVSFPHDADAPAKRFLLAELLFEDRRFAEAVTEYEAVAYASVAPASGVRPGAARQAADAGYAALLGLAALEGESADAAGRTTRQQRSVASALRFAQAFPADARTGAVLANTADKLLALGQGERASGVARQALAMQPPPAAAERRVAWAVIAHDAFERRDFGVAEQAYAEVLVLTAQGAKGRETLVERQAAAIFKQGEAARAQGLSREAVGHFGRVAALVELPAASGVRASAQFDAAAALVGLKDWERAARTLEDFRRQHPGHALQGEVAPKLALAYLELGRHALAADEFDKVATASSDPALARSAAWQAAELRDRAAQGASPKSAPLLAATQTWQRYLQQYPLPAQPAIEARWRLAALARQNGQPAQALAWTRAVQQADLQAGAERSARTRTLGGKAALALAEPVREAYQAVRLVEPLQKQLKLKKARMSDVLSAYASAAEVGVAEVTTAATFHSGTLYQDFGRALMGSQRPKKLNKAELEQYNVMLEEQAFPFEEKAIEFFEVNAARARAGVYDEWVKASYAELARLKPVRYGKSERGAAVGDTVAALEAALVQDARQPALANRLGIARRHAGEFAKAREAYEAALALSPDALEPRLNLAMLFDLYLGEPQRAQALYQRCLEISPADAGLLQRWLAELKSRKPVATAPQLASKKEGA